jgi:hypothetical protein
MIELRERPWFFWVAFAVPPLSIFLQSVAPFEPTFKAQNLAVWLGIFSAGLVLVLWLFYKNGEKSEYALQVLLVLLALVWLFQNVSELRDGSAFNHTTYFLPLLLILIYFKVPGKDDLMVAGLVLGYSLIAITLVSLILGGSFGVPNGFDVSDNGASRFPFFSELLGIQTRWGGPFGSVNFATPAGGILVLLGTLYARWNRAAFILIGSLVLFLGQARTTYFALGFALLVLFVWSVWLNRIRFSAAIRWTLMAIAAGATAVYIAVLDPTANGRTPIWSDFLGLAQDSILTGVGRSGVNQFLAEMTVSQPTKILHDHGHSVYIDGLTRYGVAWLLLTFAVFAVAFYAVRKVRSGRLSSRGLALVTFIFFAGLTETIFSWAYVTIYLLVLVLVVGLATDSKEISRLDAKKDSERVPASGKHP